MNLLILIVCLCFLPQALATHTPLFSVLLFELQTGPKWSTEGSAFVICSAYRQEWLLCWKYIAVRDLLIYSCLCTCA